MSGKTALTAVQTAVMAALAADATLMAACPGGVWDFPPAQAAFPYLYVDRAEEDPDDPMGQTQRRIVRFTITPWSHYQGRSEQYAILDSLVRLLRHTTLTVSGWHHQQTTYKGARSYSFFEVGNERAGQVEAEFEVEVQEVE